MNNEWGLTEQGFRRPTYAELLDAMEYKARELWGSGANLTVRSPLGIFLRIFAWIVNILFQVAEDVYNSRFVDTAVGASLYNLGKAIGLRLLSAQKATGYLKITGTPGTKINAGFLASTVAGIQYAVVSDVIIGDDGEILAPIQAVSAGPEGNTASNTIKEIVNPDGKETITSIGNPEPISGGALREEDEKYRDRYSKSVDIAGGVNADGLKAKLLQNVESIGSAEVYENYEDTYDEELDLPPHSFEAVVFGGLATDVARVVYDFKPFGIQPYGNTTVPVIAANGRTINVCFSRPSPVPIWAMIQNLSTDSRFPEDGIQRIKNAVISYIGGDITGGLSIGEKCYYNRLPNLIYSIDGVLDFDLTISSDGQTYGRDNISVGIREKAVTDSDKVVVLI